MNYNNGDFQQQQNADRIASRISGEIANQKRKDRKHYLRIEIAKATDRTVKAELQVMLEEIERKERNERIAMLIIGIIALVAVIFFGFTRLFYPGTEPGQQAVTTSSSSAANTNASTGETSTSSNADTSTKDANEVDTTKLTEQQIKEWVAAVLNAETGKDFVADGSYEFTSFTGSDQLPYVSVSVAGVQTDSAWTFRVNDEGYLQQDSLHLNRQSEGPWITVSTKYMDVSQVPHATTSSTNAQESSAKNNDSSNRAQEAPTENYDLPDEVLKDLTNYTKSEAQKYISEIGADYMGHESYEYSDSVGKDRVIRTSPSAGTGIARGNVVSIVYSKGQEPAEETTEAASSSSAIADNHTRAETVRTIMQANQGLDPEILANIPDEEILAANAGNATNSQIAQTAQNLINKYPELKK